MEQFNTTLLKNLYVPPANSHKGQNGKLLIIGGSHLFHASVLWALQIASKIVDMVFFASVQENNQIVARAKEEFRNGIVIPLDQIENYIREVDCLLIGPGMLRTQNERVINDSVSITNVEEILKRKDEGEQTAVLTHYLLSKYPDKKWVIDAGALQMLDLKDLHSLNGNVILTPHQREFDRLDYGIPNEPSLSDEMTKQVQQDKVRAFSKEYNSIVVLKAEKDIVCSPKECVEISGGNAGMTKGGTGDVLAGLIAALACKNELFLSALTGSYLNKKAGERLFERVGYYFNSSDLVQELPMVMKEVLQQHTSA